MKKTKVIIPALGILLLSTAASVTGTVAWFTNNNKVEATGMAIKAVVSGNLNIALGSNKAIENINELSVAINSTHLTLNPVTIDSSSVATSNSVIAQIPATWTTAPTVTSPGTAATYSDVGEITALVQDDDTKTYVAFGAVCIANKGEPGQSFEITPKCVVSDNGLEKNLSGALRAGLVLSGATGVTFTSVYAESLGLGPTLTSGDMVLTFDAISGLKNNTVYNLGLMVWYEGTDADCYVNNAINVAQCTANWSFQS